MRETTPDLTRISKYISLILRHKPEVIGIQLDAHGWADVNALLAGISKKYFIDQDILEEIVRSDSKQRYVFNEDRTRIRASQGTPSRWMWNFLWPSRGDAVPWNCPAVFRLHRGPGTAPPKPPVCPSFTGCGNSGEGGPPAWGACDLPGGCRADA